MFSLRKFAILVFALTSVGTAAYAAGEKENDALAITQAKMSLTQAVNAANEHTPGSPARAEYENSSDGWVYDIEIVNGNKVFDVKVDAQSGSVISSTEDMTDHDDSNDKKD